jgi:hypothetical protein
VTIAMKKTLVIVALVLAGLTGGYKVTATLGTAQAQDVVVGVMGGIRNDWSTEQQDERLKE